MCLFRELFTPARFRRKNRLARQRKPPWQHPSDADREGGRWGADGFLRSRREASPADWIPVYPVAVGGSFDDEVAFDLAAVNKRHRRLRCCGDCPRAFSVGSSGWISRAPSSIVRIQSRTFCRGNKRIPAGHLGHLVCKRDEGTKNTLVRSPRV